MDAKSVQPEQPGPAPLRRLLLATYDTQRRPRVVSWSGEKHVRAYARRWWIVEAPDAAAARTAIALADAGKSHGGRVVDCGRNAAGGSPPADSRRNR